MRAALQPPPNIRIIFCCVQAGTARVLRCCCSSSVVKPASSDSSEWGWNDAFVSCAPRALPQSINTDRIVVSCAVPWTYESRSPLLCCIPIRSSGCNRYAPRALLNIVIRCGPMTDHLQSDIVSKCLRGTTAARRCEYATFVRRAFTTLRALCHSAPGTNSDESVCYPSRNSVK